MLSSLRARGWTQLDELAWIYTERFRAACQPRGGRHFIHHCVAGCGNRDTENDDPNVTGSVLREPGLPTRGLVVNRRGTAGGNCDTRQAGPTVTESTRRPIGPRADGNRDTANAAPNVTESVHRGLGRPKGVTF